MARLHFDVFTLLPEVFPPYLQASILQRAIERGLVEVQVYNIRDWTYDRHHITDDVPYGGGGGMVMKPEPIFLAVESVLGAPPACPVILLTPQGRVFDQALAMELAGVEPAPELLGLVKPPPPVKTRFGRLAPAEPSPAGEPESPQAAAGASTEADPQPENLSAESAPAPAAENAPAAAGLPPRRIALLCGRYEGVDERVREHLVTYEISIGDYVLTGGELAALVLIDAVARLVPGVLGDPDGALDDSHAAGLLEYPHYTRPPEFRGWRVPEALLSGDHARISRWRREQALLRTYQRRPDLLEHAPLTAADRKFLEKLKPDA